MSDSEKSHNAQIYRLLCDPDPRWQPKEGRPGVEICMRRGKIWVRRCDTPSTLVERHTPGKDDR